MNIVKIWKLIGILAVIVGLVVGGLQICDWFNKERNHNPDITSFKLDKMQLSPNEKIRVIAEVYDDDGDQISYEWIATGGGHIVSGEQPNRALYTASAQVGNYLVILKVKDTKDGKTEDKRFIEVKQKSVKVLETESKAFGAYEIEDWANAIIYFSLALEEDPTLYTPWVFRGNAYLEKQEYQLALSDFAKAIDLFPQNDTIYLLQAKAFLLSGEQEKAIDDVKKFRSMTGDETTISLLQDFERSNFDEQVLKLDYTIRSMPSLVYVISPLR